MPLPEIVRRTAERHLDEFCRAERLCASGEELRFSFVLDEEAATLFCERRSPMSQTWRGRRSVARLVFHSELGQWTLHYPDGAGRWRFYLNAGPSLEIGKLLRHMAQDPFGVFRLQD